MNINNLSFSGTHQNVLNKKNNFCANKPLIYKGDVSFRGIDFEKDYIDDIARELRKTVDKDDWNVIGNNATLKRDNYKIEVTGSFGKIADLKQDEVLMEIFKDGKKVDSSGPVVTKLDKSVYPSVFKLGEDLYDRKRSEGKKCRYLSFSGNVETTLFNGIKTIYDKTLGRINRELDIALQEHNKAVWAWKQQR